MVLPMKELPPEDSFEFRKGAGDVLVIACGALARELIALVETNGWRHLDIQCLPAIWHNTPEKIPEGVRDAIHKARGTGRYREVFVAYGDCGTGGLLDKVIEAEGVQRIDGPHCYSFFSGNDAWKTHEDEITAFYLTDYLARHFETLVWKGFGLDRHPELERHDVRQLHQGRLPGPDRGRAPAGAGTASGRHAGPGLRIPL
jgi:hypothetical protein